VRIAIEISRTADGGAYIQMDPGVDELLADVDAGRGTTAHAYALTAWRALLQYAHDDNALQSTGQTPTTQH
jgi:hypothetical protein